MQPLHRLWRRESLVEGDARSSLDRLLCEEALEPPGFVDAVVANRCGQGICDGIKSGPLAGKPGAGLEVVAQQVTHNGQYTVWVAEHEVQHQTTVVLRGVV